MDSRIWGRLPQRILDRVIAFLPPPAFFRARCVCKRWYGLLFSAAFLELYLHLSPRHRHYFLFFTHNKSAKSYVQLQDSMKSSNANNTSSSSSSSSSSLSLLSQAFLFDPYELAWYKLSSLANLVPAGSFAPAASSGGLVCYVSNEAGAKSLLLCNPMLGSLTQLPPTVRPRLFPSVGLAVTPTAVDVTVAGDDLISPYAVKNLTSESFHIDAGGFFSLWGSSSAPLPRLCSFESSRIVHVDGKFYTMNYNPFSVLAQDISSSAWWKIQAPMRRFLRSPSLVESRGRLLLVAAVEKSQLNVPRSLRVWGLQPCGAAWAEVERMPQQLYAQFAEAEAGNGFCCVGHGEFVLVLVRGADRALLFDMATKVWQWVPPCPYSGGGGIGELHGFAYEPRLATPVTGLLDHLTQLSF